jgi:hypothetical protein
VSELSGSRNPNCTILGVEREFAPIERAEDTREEHLVVVPGEKHALIVLIAKKKRRKSGPQSFEYFRSRKTIFAGGDAYDCHR